MPRKKFTTLRPDDREPTTQSVELHGEPESAPAPDSGTDWAVVVVTQAYGPKGDSLIREDGPKFSGFGGITVHVEGGDQEGTLVLSPVHGDSERGGDIDFAPGTEVRVSCPVSGEPLRSLGGCNCGNGGEWLAIHTTPELDDSHVIVLCNRWGCHRSKVIDQGELLSTWVDS